MARRVRLRSRNGTQAPASPFDPVGGDPLPGQLERERQGSVNRLALAGFDRGEFRGPPDFSAACHQLLSRLDAFLGSISGQWRTNDVAKLTVLVLWRYNHLDPFEAWQPTFENVKVSGLSFHRSKGLEADYTILLDVSEGDYGVPSRVEDDELLNLFIPRPETYPYAEERRLFYVALTRASRGTFLLSNARQPSRFIRELCEVSENGIGFETLDGEALHQCPECLVGQMVERESRTGRVFLGCNQFPECRHTSRVQRR